MGEKLKRGTQVVFVPKGYTIGPCADLTHDTKMDYGFITSGPDRAGNYFMRFWQRGRPGVLRDRKRSILVAAERLQTFDRVPQSKVEDALADYC